MSVTIYGIKNCDTIKKAKKWLEDEKVDYNFHDFRVDGLDKDQLQNWVKELGWEVLLNTRGTTWRKLPEDVRDSINEKSAIEIMIDNPAIIKRPVLDNGKKRVVGFGEEFFKQAK